MVVKIGDRIEMNIETTTKFKVERSLYPDDKGTHVLFRYTESKCGMCIKGIFKGSYRKCLEEKRRLVNEK